MVDKNLMVTITNQAGDVIWEYGLRDGQTQGIACTQYAKNGVQELLINSLDLAISQAKGELRAFQHVD